MSNYKYINICYFCLLLGACKPANLSFSSTKHLNKNLFSGITAINDSALAQIDSVRVFKAKLTEQVVDRNDIPEFKLVNESSKKSRAINYPVSGNQQLLYLFILHTKSQGQIIIFLSTGFNRAQECTNLGPGYQGVIRQNQINFFRQVKIRETGTTYRLESTGEKTRLYFYIDEAELKNDPDKIRITQIIRDEPNKISGKKPVLYDIANVFNDPDALLFNYETSYK